MTAVRAPRCDRSGAAPAEWLAELTTTSQWRRYFETHQQLRLADVGAPRSGTPGERSALTRSIRPFQAGERSGEHLAAETWREGGAWLDGDARHAISLYMNEEHHHARILDRLLHEMGAGPAVSDLSAGAFRLTRRLMGLRAKVVVLQVAEVVGAAFYRSAGESGDAALARVFDAISDDELAHLAFGVVLVRRMIDAPGSALAKTVRRLALTWWFRATLAGALCVISIDHAPYLRRAGYRSVIGPAVAQGRWFLDEVRAA